MSLAPSSVSLPRTSRDSLGGTVLLVVLILFIAALAVGRRVM